MKTVLFACVHNAGRSQRAAAFFNALVSPAPGKEVSAGTNPGPRVHPEVLVTMREVGIYLSSRDRRRARRSQTPHPAVLSTADW